MHGGVVGRNAALLLSVGLLVALVVVSFAYVLFPHTETKTVTKVVVRAPRLLPVKGVEKSVSIAGKTLVVCTAAGRTGDGKPLDTSVGPRPGDLFVETCRGYALTAKKKGPAA